VANWAITVLTNGLPEGVWAGLSLSFFKVGAWLLSLSGGNVASFNPSGSPGGPVSYRLNEIEFSQIRNSNLYLRKDISNADTTLTFQMALLM